jgi:murein DD-endopeptidase MepM/ murein hydrolase activator NlpD
MSLTQPVVGTLVENYGHYGDVSSASFHWGLDYSAGLGADVFAASNGRVVFASTSSQLLGNGYGYVAIIQHRNGAGELIDRFSLYAHLQSPPIVAVNSEVVAGQHIADVGHTGGDYGNHLHFSVLGGIQQAGLLGASGSLNASTNISNLVRDHALQIGTFGVDAGTQTYSLGSPPYYGNIINPGTIVGDIDGPRADRILSLTGNDTIDGKSGNDTVEYQERAENIWFVRVDTTTSLTAVIQSIGTIKIDTLYNVEQIAEEHGFTIFNIADGYADIGVIYAGQSASSTRYITPGLNASSCVVDGGGGSDVLVVSGSVKNWQL